MNGGTDPRIKLESCSCFIKLTRRLRVGEVAESIYAQITTY
jgi:hypothetical protein